MSVIPFPPQNTVVTFESGLDRCWQWVRDTSSYFSSELAKNPGADLVLPEAEALMIDEGLKILFHAMSQMKVDLQRTPAEPPLAEGW